MESSRLMPLPSEVRVQLRNTVAEPPVTSSASLHRVPLKAEGEAAADSVTNTLVVLTSEAATMVGVIWVALTAGT